MFALSRSPWPDTLDGHRRAVVPFTPCAGCGAGSWAAYGDTVLCLGCATGVPPPVEAEEPTWHDLVPYLPELRELAAGRDGPKRRYRSSRYWNADSHLVGLCGEQVYSLITGYPLDARLLIAGDRGEDFPDGTNVKATKYWRAPILKQGTDEPRWPRFFALAAINIVVWRGYLVGYATAAEVRAAPVKNWGHGPRHSLEASQLHPTHPGKVA